MVAAGLRRDAADVSLFAGFLLTTLSEALPPELVEVERRRSLRERLAGQDGQVVAAHVRLGEERYSLTRTTTGAPPHASVRHEVRGIVLNRQDLPLEVWAQRLAAALLSQAAASGRSAATLDRLLGSGDLG